MGAKAVPLLSVLMFTGASPAAAAPALRETVFAGACDASGAVELDDRRFAVADDEDSVLRVYDAFTGGAPIGAYDASADLDLPGKEKRKRKKKRKASAPKSPETDIESATRMGDVAFWLTSHGRSRSGKLRPERQRFFATTATAGPALARVIGEPYERLLDDLLASKALAALGLEGAAELPAKAGGLDLEGMTARPDGALVLGLRSPLHRGRAILVPIENPLELTRGGTARLGAPITLDLGGRGVRAISRWRGRYYLVGGGAGPPALYVWDGAGEAKPIATFEAGDLNPEAFFTPERGGELMLLSDDGERPVDGVACKRLKDPGRKRFRGVWIRG